MPLSRFKRIKETVYKRVNLETSRLDTDVLNKSAPPSPTVPDWPTSPQYVANTSLWLIVDFILLLMPIAFITLAALACDLDGKEISDRGRKIQEAVLLGPTLFPLIFTALVGRSLKKIALWRAQKGTTLGFLEQVTGSQSLAATVGHAISLHSLDFLALGLLALWALSPLGGQSALRLVYESNRPILENRNVFYANPDAASLLPAEVYNVDELNRINGVVTTALMTADTLESSPIDLWNHPKIPRLEQLEQEESRNETNRVWHAIDRHANYSYAALTGVNIINLSRTGATNLTVPYEYMYFDCELSPANNVTTLFSPEYGRNETGPYTATQIQYLRDLNAAGLLQSEGAFNPSNDDDLRPGKVLGEIPGTSRLSNDWFFYIKGKAGLKPDALLYGSGSIGLSTGPYGVLFGLTYYLFECSMKSVMVEANILCESDRCSVGRLRRLNISRSSRTGTCLPYDVVNNYKYTKFFLQYLGLLGGDHGPESSNPVDAYMYGSTQFIPNNQAKNWTEYFFDPKRSTEMSHRMTRVLNTYWDSSRWPLAMTRNDPWSKTSINETSGEPFKNMTMSKTEATVIRQIPIYRANGLWVTCLVICSGVPLLIGIFSLFLSLHITVPDIFGYVSSLTRDNPYINIPNGGSSFDGTERARLLKRLPVQLGDANVSADVGYIAFRTIDGRSKSEQGEVQKRRMYR